jgi:hypothetical protein
LEVNELMSWLTMRATVTVFHNVCRDGEPMLTGYRPSDVLVPVATWTVRRWRDPEEVAEDAFRLLNVGEDPVFGKPDPVAVEYRQRGNRSLSVGDVVRVGNRWLAVAPFLFTEVDWPAAFSLVPCWPGSAPLSDERLPRRRWHLAWYGPRRVVLTHKGDAGARS